MDKVMLKGVIPEPPVIFCRDEQAQLLVMHSLHEDWSKRPTISILDEWPDEWANTNAVVVTPILVLGAEKTVSFSIVGDQEVTEEEREILNAYISIMRSGRIGRATYRDIGQATGHNRRMVQRVVKNLAEKGIGTYKFNDGFKLDIFKLVLDNEKAKALGINIKEY